MYGSPHATNIVFNVCYYYVKQWLTLLVMQQVIPVCTYITTVAALWNIRWCMIGWRCSGKVCMGVNGFVETTLLLFAKLWGSTKQQCGLFLHTQIFLKWLLSLASPVTPNGSNWKENIANNQSTTARGQIRTLTMAKSVYLMCMCAGLSTSSLWLR